MWLLYENRLQFMIIILLSLLLHFGNNVLLLILLLILKLLYLGKNTKIKFVIFHYGMNVINYKYDNFSGYKPVKFKRHQD